MPWPNARENPGPLAEGRYCLAVCYCGECPHYEPPPSARPRRPAAAQNHHQTRDAVWRDQREDNRR